MITSAAPDLAAKEQRMEQLLAEILDIEAQLGRTTRLGPDGQPLGYRDYLDWKGRAKRARAGKVREYREIKEAVKRARATSNTRDLAERANLLNPRDTEEMALALHRILVRVQQAGFALTVREVDTLRLVEDYFRNRGL